MTFAQFIGDSTTGIIGVMNTIIVPIIGALIFLVFVYGVIKYFFLSNKGDDTGLAEGRWFIFWGILGTAVYFSVWGFVNLALSTLGI